MKRALAVTLFVLLALGVSGQEKNDAPAYTTTRDFRNRVFEIRHRDPRIVASAVKLLGSGFQGADLSVNEELSTVTVRDFPENIAAIEEAIGRLDKAEAGQPEIEFHVYVLIGSTAPTLARELPDEIVDVVKELKATLRYSSYGLMTNSVHRTRPGSGVESSGVAETKLLGMSTPDLNPIIYSYTLRRVTVPQGTQKPSVDIENFRFSMRIPIALGNPRGEHPVVQYQDVGFQTPVTIHEGEKVVVGTTTMGDKALVVVVLAKIEK
jgi:hypothetical protein